MKLLMLVTVFLISALALTCRGQEYEGDEDDKKVSKQDSNWWTNFKQKVKTVVTKWREDLKKLWDEVLAKASDMKTWTGEMIDSFKLRFKKWLESNPELPEDEKNEIETFISKLKASTEKPKEKDAEIDP